MTSPMSDLLTGLAQYLANAGVGTYSTDPTVIAAPGSTAITIALFPASPDRAITLAAFSQGDDSSMPIGNVMIQVRSRGNPNDPLDAEAVGDAAYYALQGLTQQVFGSVTLINLSRKISVPMGMDKQSQRWGRLDQFYGQIAYAPTALRPDGGAW